MALKIAILASGTGSNFAALADAMKAPDFPKTEMVGLICNKKGAAVLEKAAQRNIPAFLLDGFPSKEAYEEALIQKLKSLAPDYILLAGYLKIVSKAFLDAFQNRVINIHPSLLPSFPGLHAVRQAIDYGVAVTGVTVHFVTPELDAGPIIAQASTDVKAKDTEASLYERLQPIEHATYVAALKKVLTHRYRIVGRKVEWT